MLFEAFNRNRCLITILILTFLNETLRFKSKVLIRTKLFYEYSVLLLANFCIRISLNDESRADNNISNEDYLAGLYYEFAMKSSNRFLQKWFEFNLNINNLLTAIACRKHDFDPKAMIIGQNEISNTIRQSNARDFGLSGMFDQLEVLMRIAEETDLLEREKKIDALKWEWLDENTFFHYFGVEKVLAFVLKVEMLERWRMLSVEKGAQIFRELLAGMKQGVKFDNINS